jgi:hypothetical protein
LQQERRTTPQSGCEQTERRVGDPDLPIVVRGQSCVGIVGAAGVLVSRARSRGQRGRLLSRL